jgi:hypothetical protein
MAKRGWSKSFIIGVVLFVCISLCGCSGLKYHDIYTGAFGGAVVGAIIGHQSDECGAGAALGAAVGAVGQLLSQIDEASEREVEEAAEEVAKGNYLLGPASLEAWGQPGTDAPAMTP